MIKFIATDMDGTLLDDNKTVNKSIFSVLDYINKKDIMFCAASGRQYSSLKKIFKDYSNDIMFIAENGAYVVYKNKELYSNYIDRNLLEDIINKCNNFCNMIIMLCCKDFTYTIDKISYEALSSKKFDYDIKLVKNLLDVKDDVLKVSISAVDISFDNITHSNSENPNIALKNIEKFLIENFDDKTEITVSGFNCIDIVNKNVSKGQAIDNIFSKMNININEAVVFGDNFNDIEMFKKAYYSFAMKNSVDEIKKRANFITEYTNNECGVVKEIIKLSKKGVL